MKKFLPFLSLFIGFMAQAQTTDSTARLSFGGYVETYYTYDFGKPPTHDRAPFLYNFNRHNEFNVNLAYLKGSYSSKKIRANLALMAGTYANANLVAETGVMKNVFEANVGWQINSKWSFDVGILPSHIGFESAVGKDCWTLTRSLAAENSPYYETGVKLNFIPNSQWSISGLVLNGWQRIRRVDGNNTPALGAQVVWKPNERNSLNYSTFVGSDKPDSVSQMRVFHNVYGIFQLSEKWALTLGFDIGTEQKTHPKNGQQVWYTPVAIVRFTPSEKWRVAARFEQYSDVSGVIVASDFRSSGGSLNLDFAPLSNALLRIEARYLNSKNKIFPTENGFSDKNFAVTTAMMVSF